MGYWQNAFLLIDSAIYISLYLHIAEGAYDYRLDDTPKTIQHVAFLTYLYIELYAFPAMIFSYVFFLLSRSLTKHKLLAELEVPEHKRLPIIDTVIALKMLADMFVNVCFGWIMSILVFFSPEQ